MTTKEAQSEAPGVDTLDKIFKEYQLGNATLKYQAGIDQAKAKINRLIVEAELRGFNVAFDCHDYDRLREYRQALSNNLSKGDDNASS